MIEHLLILLIDQIAKKEQAKLQASLAETLPEFDSLWNSPKETLTDGDVIICPKRSLWQGLVLSGVVGLIVFALLILVGHFALVLWANAVGPAQPPEFVVIFVVVGMIATVASVARFAYGRLHRTVVGGEIVATRASVEFRLHETAVACPWSLFRADGPFRGDVRAIVLPINPRCADRVELLRHGGIVDGGRAVQTRAFQFISENEIELRNVYAANLRDVARLLQHLGRKLG